MAKKEQTLAIPQQKQSFFKMIRKNKYYFLMALPAVVSTFIFCYIPMYGRADRISGLPCGRQHPGRRMGRTETLF